MSEVESFPGTLKPDKIILHPEQTELFYEDGVPDAPEPTNSIFFVLPVWEDLRAEKGESWDDVPVEDKR